jgi:hypothetical protein
MGMFHSVQQSQGVAELWLWCCGGAIEQPKQEVGWDRWFNFVSAKADLKVGEVYGVCGRGLRVMCMTASMVMVSAGGEMR